MTLANDIGKYRMNRTSALHTSSVSAQLVGMNNCRVRRSVLATIPSRPSVSGLTISPLHYSTPAIQRRFPVTRRNHSSLATCILFRSMPRSIEHFLYRTYGLKPSDGRWREPEREFDGDNEMNSSF